MILDTTKAAQTVGDYDLRGPDFETLLVGPIIGQIIDADRLVREGYDGWQNGFPNWTIYRCTLAGDTHLRERLRLWCVAFAVAYLEGRRGASDELGALLGWDSYQALLTTRWAVNGADVDDIAGVSAKTYRKLRNSLFARLRVSLDEYWMRMQIGMRQVALLERRQEAATPTTILHDGRGFDDHVNLGDGNLRAYPRGSGC